MKNELKVRFTKTRSGDPLVDIEDLGGFGLEYTPEQYNVFSENFAQNSHRRQKNSS